MIDTIGMTDIGNGRPSNQDAYLLRQKEKNGKLYLLAVVCDGMGGLKKGEMASHYIVEVLKQWFDETLFDGLETMGIDMIEQNLIDLIRRINQNLLLMSRRMHKRKGPCLISLNYCLGVRQSPFLRLCGSRHTFVQNLFGRWCADG